MGGIDVIVIGGPEVPGMPMDAANMCALDLSADTDGSPVLTALTTDGRTLIATVRPSGIWRVTVSASADGVARTVRITGVTGYGEGAGEDADGMIVELPQDEAEILSGALRSVGDGIPAERVVGAWGSRVLRDGRMMPRIAAYALCVPPRPLPDDPGDGVFVRGMSIGLDDASRSVVISAEVEEGRARDDDMRLCVLIPLARIADVGVEDADGRVRRLRVSGEGIDRGHVGGYITGVTLVLPADEASVMRDALSCLASGMSPDDVGTVLEG